MIKIYIDNEEVVANQSFTINKHMLNTPSVVLNNVCPKSWCENKDYTTNFYHPLDYSKCKIQDETYYPEDPGTIVSSTNALLTITNADITKSYELTQIDGNTTQSGTPTPSSPQPINVVSGRQDINVAGKNLLKETIENLKSINTNGTWNENVYSYNGIDFTVNDDLTIKMNGTSTGNAYINLYMNTTQSLVNDTTQTYTFSKGIGNTNIVLVIYERINNDWSPKKYVNTATVQYTPTGQQVGHLFRLLLENNKTVNNVMTYPMLVKGAYSLQTIGDYETYKGQSYEINLGKQLLNLKNGTYTATNGITATVENGEITLNGTSTEIGFVQIDLNTRYNLEKNIPYTVSANNSVANADVRIRLDNNGNLDTYLSNINASRTITYNNETLLYTKVAIRVASGITLTNYKFRPMLEKGSVATSYSPYKTPIELCKIGDYKDRIYKENGTWYIEKQVGKVVLNGTNNAFASKSGTSNNIMYSTSPISNIKRPSGGAVVSNMYSSHFVSKAPNTLYLNNTLGTGINTDGSIACAFGLSSTLTTKELANTWLSSNNIIAYYILATPTYTEITDSELLVQLNSLQLLEGLNNISITSGDLPGEITIHYNYSAAYTTIDLLFCGVVKNSGNISLNPREPHYTSLQILDFKDFLSSGETLDFVIYQKTILEAIQQVIGTIQDYGFVLGNVNILNQDDIIGAYSTKDKTAYDVFNYIADITQSRWTTRMIDENHVAIDFYDPTLMPEGTEIDYTTTFFNNNLIDDMKYSYGTNNYRNKQVMISNQVYSNISQAQTIVANGYQTQFPTEQPIGKINSITSNGTPLTFATFNEKDMGYVADFYYNPGDNYFESDNLRSTGEVLIIDYVAIVEGRQVITNATEIDRIEESTGRKGIIARYETRNDATTSTELQKIGESYIKYKGTPEIKLTIESRKNIWEVGQRVQFNAPIDELDTEYMVRSKKINYIYNQQDGLGTLFYTYELTSSFNSETEINYFDNQRAKASGNIGEGEYISRNIDIESTANIIFYDTETTEVQVSGDNELNAILNSPFIS